MNETAFSYEESLKRIHQIVSELQDGRAGFEQLLSRYEEASGLIEQCRSFLDDSELVIRKVTGVDGSLQEVDFQ